MFLIGSQALNFHKPLVDRVPADWDILCDSKQSPINNVEFYFKDHPTDKTNADIYEYCQKMIESLSTVETPVGLCYVAPMEILKVLKIASANELNKFKHQFDLNTYFKDIQISSELLDLAQKRKEEIKLRVQNQKDQFFNKYQVERYIDHDEIHKEANSSPTYLKVVLTDGVSISQDLFNQLSKSEQISLIREECFVLAMERFLIFNYKQNPGSLYALATQFQDTTKSSMPMLFWLHKMATVGALKDHPDWLALWVESNFFEILENMDTWWNTTFHNVSESFWKKIIS